jgi:ABC-type glycerol-3-phosphate transport system substrate-binding protein
MKNASLTSLLIAGLMLAACGGKKETAASVAQKWCDLNAKVYKAADGPEKEAAAKAREDYENKMEEKYKGDKAFMDQVEVEVEKCEAASEGR